MSFSTFYPYLVHISAFSVVIPIALCFKCYKHLNRVSKLMLIYLILSLLTEIILAYQHSINISSNIPFLIFSLFEFSLIVAMFFNVLKLRTLVKNIFIGLTILGFVLYVYGLFQSNQLFFNSYYNLYLFVLALFFIVKEDRDLNIPNLLDNYFYWYNTGFLVFFGTSFFLTVFDDFIVTATNGLGVYLWTIHLLVNMIFYAAISIGIWKTRLT